MSDPHAAAPHGHSGFRPDIQGLRAIAVLLVLVFHVLPNALPGGFVGVDVFFVISGFLITGLLVRELEAKGRISLATFYVRRIKRLLPAATLVLVAAALASLWLLPVVRWKDTAEQLIASAIYAQNWLLLRNATDYWAQDTPQSPVVHYWSLSIEEQFYMLWPCVMLLGALVVRARRTSPRAALAVLSALIFVGSLVYSVLLTGSDPGAAYFSTGTRAWELALGAFTCIALVPLRARLPNAVARTLGWVGLCGVLASGLVIRETMAFPGWVALAPTVSAALLLLVGPVAGTSHARLLSTRPMQYLGDVSYSIYLWHWPLIVFFKARFDRAPTLVDAAVLVAITLVLAHASKYLVEDPVRGWSFGNQRSSQGFGLGVALVAVSVAVAWLPLSRVRALEGASADASSGKGALALLDPAQRNTVTERGSFVPSAMNAKKDLPTLVAQGCHVGMKERAPKACEFGDVSAPIHIVLAGDSHAAQWAPSLLALADTRRFHVTTITKTSCPPTTEELLVGTKHKRGYVECTSWNRALVPELERLHPTLVLVSHAAGYELEGVRDEAEVERRLAKGYHEAIQQMLAKGLKVLAIRDTPLMGFDVPDCVAQNPDELGKCAVPRARALSNREPASAGLEPKLVVDLSDYICASKVCSAVVGGVLVYRDSNHLTATYAKTLAPLLWPHLQKLVEG